MAMFIMYAPLGEKDCHYNKVVQGLNAQGLVVTGDNAPRYGHDTQTGQPIVSYDEGKTWDWLGEGLQVDLHVTKVEISWTKVTDEQ
jgi:hypothetical protein